MKIFKKLKLLSLEKGFSSPRDFLISELKNGKTICQVAGEIGVERSNLGLWADKNNVPRPHNTSTLQKIKELGYDSEYEYFMKNWYKSFSGMAYELDTTMLAISTAYGKFRKEMIELKESNTTNLFVDQL